MSRVAVVAGATGIVGRSLSEHLVSEGWDVVGLARRPVLLPGARSIGVDLVDRAAVAKALDGIRPSHVFFATWSRQPTEAENIRVNGAMMKGLLDAVRSAGTVEHVALVTGLKHFIGPFESYARGAAPDTPLRESSPRLELPNFYYDLEDRVFRAAKEDGFGWSVHRPHTMIGYADANVMNMGTTLATYASIVRATGRPFAFPGNAVQWNGLTDMTDARLLARHLLWAATTPAARNQALHVVNGDVFRWSWMWGRIAAWFGLAPAPFTGEGIPLATQLADAAPVWRRLVEERGLREPVLERLASPWHTDADLRRPFEVLTDMSKSRELGFTAYQATDQAFFDHFARLRDERIIP